MKRSRLLLVVILVAVAALVGSLWVGEGPLWRMVMLKRVPLPYLLETGQPSAPVGVIADHQRGWMKVRRWSDPPVSHGRAIAYWISTGFKAHECEVRDGVLLRATTWTPDGAVQTQIRQIDDEGHFLPADAELDRDSPPWWWGVTDETEPTAPWWGKE